MKKSYRNLPFYRLKKKKKKETEQKYFSWWLTLLPEAIGFQTKIPVLAMGYSPMIGQVVPADSQNTTGSYICSWIPTTIVLEQSHPAVGCSCSNTELPGKTCYHMNVLRVTNCFLIESKKLSRREYIYACTIELMKSL